MNDAGELAQVAAQTFPLACPPGMDRADIEAFVAVNLSSHAFGHYLSSPEAKVIIGRRSGMIGGYTITFLREPTDADVAAVVLAQPSAELSKCYVLPQFHGGALAGQLMVATMVLAAEHGARSLWLGVNQANRRAQRFYTKFGFQMVGERQFMVGTMANSDHVMARLLAEPGTIRRVDDLPLGDQRARKGESGD
jgi:ribosomal protein S18 acetylase RimI-like enzyme